MRKGILALSFCAASALLADAAPDAVIRALIFSGRNNHDWRTTTPQLRKLLADTGRFDVRVIEEPAGTTAKTLGSYDLLVLDYNGPRWGEQTEQAVENFVRSGKGMVVFHAANYPFVGNEILADGGGRTGIRETPWPAYAKMIGGYWSTEPPKSGHAAIHSFPVKLVDRGHPITRGMTETFIATDQLCHHLRMQPSVHVLASAYDEPSIGGTGKDEPILWTVNYGKGRVFQTTLGHDLASMAEPGFIATFLRGAEWAATGTVKLPPDAGSSKYGPEPVRVLLVTGGHAYDNTFHSVLEVPGLETTVTPHPAAFRQDQRKRFDVLVLYDMVDDLEPAKRKHLQEFVESGKGFVVLHHAICSFNAWPWYEEVVGGRYFRQAEGSTPKSTFQHGVELFVEPVVKHPVTTGIIRMHLIDETYKGMRISPKVQVLLKTDNPASDGPLAWISPYQKSRAVYIELGHGPEAHLHQGYRRLVKNAILWAAGKEIK